MQSRILSRKSKNRKGQTIEQEGNRKGQTIASLTLSSNCYGLSLLS